MLSRIIHNSNYRLIGLVIILFTILALLRTGPALFEGGSSVAAFAVPDTYMHLWVFWRTKNALLGRDCGYFTSHMLTYPATVREPMAVYDPLLPLLSVPLQLILPSLFSAYNLLTTLGLIFTGVSGYLLIRWLTKSRAGGILGGMIMVMNPFLYRQLAGGFIEYAWWGVMPLAIWLYLKYISRPDPWTIAIYLLSLIFAFLLAIYSASYLVIIILLITLYQIQAALRLPGKKILLRIFKIHTLTLICILPLLIFWICNLSRAHYKSLPWKEDFSIPEEVSRTFSNLHSSQPPVLDLISTPPAASKRFTRSFALKFRVLYSSLDLHDLLSFIPDLSSPVREANLFQPGSAEKVYGREWLLVLLLAAGAFLNKQDRRKNLKWLGLGLLFLILAMGPFPIWKGRFFTSVGLPYRWLYKWVPGFSRLLVPARAFLVTILALSLLAGRGLVVLTRKLTPRSLRAKPFFIPAGSAVLIFLTFISLGNIHPALPRGEIEAPVIYERIAEENGEFALLELPLEGNLTFRTYCQTIHGKPIFQGAVPDFMLRRPRPPDIFKNHLVRFLIRFEPGARPQVDLKPDILSLSRLGFRYLILHGAEYKTEQAFPGGRALLESYLGPPVFEDREVVAWRLPAVGEKNGAGIN